MKLRTLPEKNKIPWKYVFLNEVSRHLSKFKTCIIFLLFTLPLFPLVLPAHGVNAPQENIMLTEALNRLSKKYEVFFSYDQKSIEHVEVTYQPEQYKDVRHALDQLLSGTTLQYKIFDNRYIILYEQSREAISSLKGMVRHLETVIDNQENEDMLRRFTKPVAILHPLIRKQIQPLTFTVSGQVTDQYGEPLIGVNLQVKGTNSGTATDFEGNFTLEDIDENAVLVVSYIGYQTQEVPVAGKSNLTITMVSDSQLLDEVIVVGYGTVKKSDLTGSVQRIEGETFQNQPMTQLTEMLTGTVAGFNASQGTTAAGGSSLEIRGPTSLNANTEPLIVLDGAIYNGSLADISPNDIESIDVLKDASSAAVFGSRAASGVLIITTKKGTSGKPNITFSTNIGLSEVTNKTIRPLSPTEYLNFRRDYQTKQNPDKPEFYYYDPNNLPGGLTKDEWLNFNSNPSSDITEEWLNRLTFFPAEVRNYQNGQTINWFDKSFRSGIRQNYDLSVNGGSKEISYFLSLGHTNNQGIIVGDDFSTIRTRLNVDAKVTDYLNIGLNGQFSNRDNSAVPANLNQYYVSSPFGSMYEEDGSLKWFPNDYAGAQNPLLNTVYQNSSTLTNSLFSRIYATLKLPFGFEYKPSFQPRYEFFSDYNFWSSNTPTGADVKGRGTREEQKVFEWMIDNLVTWDYQFRNHTFNLTLLYNLEKYQSWGTDLVGTGFAPNENLSFNALQFASNQTIVNSDNYSTGDALMGRINYMYGNKYLFTASLRRDGYSAFGQGNSRALFPAAAIAWKISEEGFYNSDLVSSTKLRFSWGINGNRDIGRYAALAQLDQNIYYNGSNILVGVYNNSLENPELSWERTEAVNFGFDLGILDERINGSFEIYQMTTHDLLMNRILPKITGFENVASNLGELKNRGLEVTLSSVNISRGDIQWSTNLLFSLNRNKIISLFGDFEEIEVDGQIIEQEVSDISNEWFIGEAIDRIWDYNLTGVWQTEEADEAEHYGQAPGDYKAEDVNNDGVYSQLEDKQFIGWEKPRYRFGLRNEFQFFKNISLSFFIRGELGHMGSLPEYEHERGNLYDRLGMRNIPYWTAANPSNKYASLITASNAFGGGYNRYFDRSYVRVQDLSLSYRLPDELLNRVNIQNLRFYTSIRNLYSFDNWPDWDPESNDSPMPRTYSVGFHLTL